VEPISDAERQMSLARMGVQPQQTASGNVRHCTTLDSMEPGCDRAF
jgi:hypothetical protein